MKQLGVLALLMLGGPLVWLLATRLSPDALGLAIGLFFGMFAALPLELMIVVAERRGRHPIVLDPWQDDEPDPWQDDEPPALTVTENHYHLHLHGDVRPEQLARFPGERPAALITTNRRDV